MRNARSMSRFALRVRGALATSVALCAAALIFGSAPAQAQELDDVLVFSKTEGFRHDSIPAGIAAIQQLGTDNDFNVDATEDAADFNDANLAGYDAVVWLSTTGDVLNESQQGAFERYMQADGGYVGIHAAADTEYDWEWYGQLLGGAYFDSHPPGTPDASIDVEDGDEPSTQHLPARWDRTDEWYNYQANPRPEGVNVLATLDESTYAGGNMGDDHPIAWCTDFDGGRAWYTGGGHTQGSFSEPDFTEHILGGIRTAARDVAADCGDERTPPTPPTPGEFQKTQLAGDQGAGQPNTLNPMEIEVAPDGTVFYTERRGVVGAWDPDTETAREIGTVPVTTFQENGLMGIALAPDYELSGWIYLSYSALPLESLTQRVSRFRLDGNGDLDLASEVPVFEWTHLRETCCHSAGALEFDPDGNLLITTGDNTNPFESQGYAPIDERPGRESWDAQRTSANTNDHNGKLLRITPLELIGPATQPGIGDTYTIPNGNMFDESEDLEDETLPEIHSMGFRNPFRFKVDAETGWTLLADYGPDSGSNCFPNNNPPCDANPRGPQGTVEFNVIREPINSGWPYCVREDTAYYDGQFADPDNTFTSTGEPFDCANPVNTSPNNTGHTELPPVFPATMWQGQNESDPRVPGLGPGGAPMSGPRYYFDPSNPSETKFPAQFDGKWFIASWNNDWIKTVELDSEGEASNIEDFPNLNYLSPMDMEFGPDGALYLAEWGQGFGADHDESGIYRIDFVQLTGPQVTASADPERGMVPLDVEFDGQATDSEGNPNPNFTYEWDFGDGSPISTEEDPTHTYTETGTYTATLTVTDPETEEEGTDSVEIRVDPEDTCPTGPRSDEFEGDALDSKWTVIRPDDTNPFSVSDGELHLPIDNGSIYGPGTSARNIIVQPLPSGEVTVTAKLRADELSEDYHQAGLRVYSDDNNWASVHMISAGGQRDFEFIWEADGNPRNEAADKLGGIPSNAPLEYYVRLISDGDELTAEYSYDGETFLPVGRPGSLDTFDNPHVGPVALSDAAPSVPMSHFDWIRFDPDASGGGGGDTVADEFDGAELEMPPWETVRPNANLTVSGGALRIPAEQGDLYGGSNTAQNLVLRDAPEGPWEATAEVNFVGDAQYHQAGILVYGDDSNYTKLGRIAHTPAGDEKFEYIYETGGTPRNEAADSTGNLPGGFPDDYLVRITSDGTNITGAYSTDGTTWTPVGRPAPLPADARVGMFAFNNEAATAPEAAFERFELTTGGGGGPSRSDQFDGDSLDTERWNAIVNDNPDAYEVAGGQLTITTEPGDIYTGDTVPPPNNFILQSADHAAADWTIETKVIGGALDGFYSQGGLMAMEDFDNYVKFDLISDDGQTAVNRIELRSEVGAAIQEPQPQVTPLPAGTEDAWLRLTKEGESYTGEYSFDGETWLSIGDPVANPMAAPDFGLFAIGVNQSGDDVSFDYFTLEGENGGCPPGGNPPVIEEATASPTAGFAPLEVDFSAQASDPDGDELSYSWDFDGNGTEDSIEQNPTHTYTEAGEHGAELTVSDGTDTDTETVDVTVFEEDDPEASFRTLVFSKTAGFRHGSIGVGHDALEQLGEDHGFQVDHTEDASLFREDVLSRYDTITFLSTTGDVLNQAQQDAFEAYVQAGGGYTGIHSASDTEYEWPWYGDLVGAYFRNHPPGTPTATVDVEDQDHPSTAGQPDSYTKVDEWYNFQSPEDPVVGGGGDDYSPRENVHVLASVDETTYDEQDGNATDDDHPVIWCHDYDGGRSWYTALGHTNESFGEDNFLEQVLGGLETTAGVEPSETCGVTDEEDATPPVTTAQLNGADPMASYDGPVDVSLSATDPDEGGAEPQTHQVGVEGCCSWDTTEVQAVEGDTVEWDFEGGGHDICIDDSPPVGPAGFDDCGDDEVLGSVSNGDTGGEKTFTEAGSYAFYCSFHYPGMEGTVEVAEGSGGGTASGVDITQYRVTSDGVTGEWVENENTVPEDPFLTEFTVSEPGSHSVEYYSTDNASNAEDPQTVAFEITDGPEPVAELRAAVQPKRKTLGKRAKQTAFRFKVRNVGDAATSGPLTLCAKAPRKRLRVVGKACQKAKALQPKTTTAKRFKFKVKPKARGKTTRIKFVVRAKGTQNQSAVAKLRVKR